MQPESSPPAQDASPTPTPGQTTNPTDGESRTNDGAPQTPANNPPKEPLLKVLEEVKFLIKRPAKGVKLPKGWSFHPVTPRQTQSKSDPTSSAGVGHDEQGYFHRAELRITTNIDICEGVPFAETNSDDEFAEIVVIEVPSGEPNDTSEKDNRPLTSTRFHVDHFNRTFSYDLGNSQHDNDTDTTNTTTEQEAAYMKWIELMSQNPDSHLYQPSADSKKYSCLGRKIAQQVVWDHQNGHITKIDIENAFSPAECNSLLSALQKKRVTDKQCQKIIRTVINRFLSTKQFKQPRLESSLKATDEESKEGRIVVLVALLAFIIWIGPMLSIPAAYFRRLRTMAAEADKGAYLPHLWRTFIKVLLKEWSDLSIVLALVLAANVAFLALPGTSERPELESSENYSPILADISRGAGIVSMFVTLGGLLTTLCLIWLHQPMQGTGSSDACKYLLGSAYNREDPESQSSKKPRSLTFLRLVLMATYLGMPLVLLLWSVIAFVISAATWTFLFSTRAAQITVVTLCGWVLMTPLVTIVVFWGPIISRDSLFAKATRGGDQASP